MIKQMEVAEYIKKFVPSKAIKEFRYIVKEYDGCQGWYNSFYDLDMLADWKKDAIRITMMD